MSRLNRKQLKKLLLKEFKMMGMAPMGGSMIGHSPYQQDYGHDDYMDHNPMNMHHGHNKGSVSKEDCCKAILCLIECCDCPKTQEVLRECCEDILSGHYEEPC